MASLDGLAPEVIEYIFDCTQDSTPSVNRLHLLRLQLVSKRFCPIARRLLYRSIHIAQPLQGQRFLETLEFARSERLGDLVRSLKVSVSALSKREVFSDLSQDDILRQTPNLASLDSPVCSFAPLSDGRRPFASWPSTLKSIVLAPTFRVWSVMYHGDDYDSDDSDHADGTYFLSSSDAISILNSLPNALTSLTISRTFVHDLSSAPTTTLQHLRAVTLDVTNTPYATLKWLTAPSIANRKLKSLKVWSCSSITAENLVELFSGCGADLEEFTYKPVAEQGVKFPALRLIGLNTPNLRRLSLGNKAADHTLYALLPRSLTHLTVCLPERHVNARLSDIEPIIKTRLRNLVKLELYSQIYFPSPDITYAPTLKSENTSLREIRLSHVSASQGAIESFLSSVGSTIQTLALHHVSSPFSSMLFSSCPNLRRLDLGRGSNTNDEGEVIDLYSTTDHRYLHSLKVHFDSSLRLEDLIDEIEVPRLLASLGGGGGVKQYTYLKTLGLVGSYPSDISNEKGWKNAKLMNKLMQVAKEKGCTLLINGRMIESAGDLWVALMGQNLE